MFKYVFFSLEIQKIICLPLKNAFLLFLPFKEISTRPELSSQSRFRILGRYSKHDRAQTDGNLLVKYWIDTNLVTCLLKYLQIILKKYLVFCKPYYCLSLPYIVTYLANYFVTCHSTFFGTYLVIYLVTYIVICLLTFDFFLVKCLVTYI